MKTNKLLGFALLISILLSFSACYSSHHHVPPGQAKKMYRGKSAKRYAPGQKKKVKKSKGYQNLFPR